MRSYIVIGAVVLLILGSMFMVNQLWPTSPTSQFNPTPEQLVTDLNGQMVGLPYGQAWPFDPTQKVQVSVIHKKFLCKLGEEFIVIFANVQAQADVTPIKNKDEKDPPKDAPKLPKRVALSGVVKMTYEQVGSQWYLVYVEGVGTKAVPLD